MTTFYAWFRNQTENCKATGGRWNLNFVTARILVINNSSSQVRQQGYRHKMPDELREKLHGLREEHRANRPK